MLDHPVGGGLAQALGILVDEGVLVVVGLCVVDKALGVALDLGEGVVGGAVELVFDGVEGDGQLCEFVVVGQLVLVGECEEVDGNGASAAENEPVSCRWWLSGRVWGHGHGHVRLVLCLLQAL